MVSLKKGLVGHWTMDERDTSGGTLYDRSAYDNNGTLAGTPVTGEPSIIGESYELSGDNVYTSQDSKKIKAVMFWLKTSTLSGSYNNYNSWNVTNDQGERKVRTENDNTPDRLYTRWIVTPESAGINGGGVWTRSGSYDYADNNWHHYASTFNGDVIKEYWDGEVFTTKTGIGGSVPETTGTFDILGSDYNISDVRIYNRVLSESDISALYNMRSQRQKNFTTAHTDNLVLSLNARNENSYQQGNTVWHDISGNGYDAFGDPNDTGAGTDSSQFPEWQPQNGGRFYFDGNKGLTITDTMSTSGKLTIETWMKRSTSGSTNYLSDARNGAGTWHLTNYSDSNINISNSLEADDPDTYQTNSNWWGDWHHFVMTSDDTNSKLYVDGQQITDSRLKSSNGFNTGLGQYFRIGNRYTSTGRLVGHISTYRLYDDVLSTGQVKSNYNAEKMYHK